MTWPILLPYLYIFTAMLDLCDMNGSTKDVRHVQHQQSIAHLLNPREIYVPVLVETQGINP